MIGKALAVACAAVAIAYLAVCGLLYLSQRSYLYYPAPRQGDSPAFVLHRGDADVVVSTNGVEGADAVLYFGGNAEDVSQAIAPLARTFPGRAVYAMHYRSYGGSTGTPSERALVADAQRLFEVVAKDHPRIVVIGRSLGSGIAIQVAAGNRIERLVLVTPYDSIAALAADRFRWFPVRLLLRDRYESWRYAPRIRVPTTLVVAGRDKVIPNDSSLRLAARFAPGIAHVASFADAGHNDVSEFPGYLEALAGRHPNGEGRSGVACTAWALVAVACMAAFAGCGDGGKGSASPSQSQPCIPQPVVETPHYRIHGAATQAQTRDVAVAVEALHAAYAKTFGIGPVPARLDLVLYRDQAQFKANNRSAPWAEAYYREPRSYAYPGNGNNPHHWMLHEATHQLLRQASGFRLRKWANEGVASYFGAGTLRNGVLEPGNPDRDAYPIWWLASMRLSGDLQADIDRGDIIPIRQLVEDSGPPIAENVNAYYIHYWSLAHYLLHGDGGRHRAAFLQLLRHGGGAGDFQRLIGPYAQTQQGWYEYLRELAEQQRAAGAGKGE